MVFFTRSFRLYCFSGIAGPWNALLMPAPTPKPLIGTGELEGSELFMA